MKAIYFDLDDTLCAYWDASKAALKQTFTDVPIEGYSPEEMIRNWAAAFQEFGKDLKATGWYETYLKVGEPTRTEQMRLTLRRVGVDDLAKAKELSESYMVLRDKNLKLFPEAIEVLDALKGKYVLGLITNGPADIQRQEVNTLGIAHYFDHIWIEGEMGEGKPVPRVFERAVEAAGSTPETTLMVGNSYKHDVAAAIAMGWNAIWIRRPSDVPPSAGPEAKPEERPQDGPVPTRTISDLRELYDFLRMSK